METGFILGNRSLKKKPDFTCFLKGGKKNLRWGKQAESQEVVTRRGEKESPNAIEKDRPLPLEVHPLTFPFFLLGKKQGEILFGPGELAFHSNL